MNECHKKQIFQRMAKLWRDHRSLLLKEVKKQAELVGLQTAAAMLKPDNIHSMDEWLTFIKSRMTPAFMVIVLAYISHVFSFCFGFSCTSVVLNFCY